MLTETRKEIGGWGNYPLVESYVVQPRSKDELSGSLQAQIIARGLGRSYGDQAINENKHVAICTYLNHLISFDDQTGILECEAGVSLEEIITTFGPRGWLPMICPGTKFVTIGGAIANDIHGKAHHIDGSFVNCLLSFTILLADGRILTASRTENSDLFWGSVGGLGLLGIITTARIRLRKVSTTYFRQKSVKVNNLTEMLEAVERYDKEYNYSVAWIDALAKGNRLGSGVLSLGNAATVEDLPASLREEPLKIHRPNALISVPLFMPDFTLNNFTVRILNMVIGVVQNSPKQIVHYEKFFFPLDAIGNWNKGYGKRGFIQYQFVIPETDGRATLTTILEMIGKSGCTPFLNVFKKMGAGQGLLSFPFAGYTLAIDFPVTPRLKAFTAELDAVVLQAGGRLYLGKDALLTRDGFRAMYPLYKEWLAIKNRYDPQNVFSSNISRRLGLEAGA